MENNNQSPLQNRAKGVGTFLYGHNMGLYPSTEEPAVILPCDFAIF